MLSISKRSLIRISLFNLCLVALIGTLMRYKIPFELPLLNQRYLLHAHSHFAFIGWVGHTLLVLITNWLANVRSLEFNQMKFYKGLILTNLFFSYGILISFTYGGYTPVSNTFSFGSVLVNAIFAIRFFKDTVGIKHPTLKWFRAAFLFYLIASIGTLSLAYLMVSGQITQKLYLLSIYFYLHFQYNGWFFFACSGLLFDWVYRNEPAGFPKGKNGFLLFLYSCIPAFLLSALWLDLPVWLISLVALASLMQLLGYFQMGRRLLQSPAFNQSGIPGPFRFLLILSALSLGIKLALQAASTVPEVSHLAFGFRNIVIAYLHLVLLCIVSLFLLVYFRIEKLINGGKTYMYALLAFAAFAYLNELTLGIQGVASFSYIPVPGGDMILLVMAAGLLLSALTLFFSVGRKKYKVAEM